MSFRKRKNESDDESDDDNVPLNVSNEADNDDESGPSAKKSRNVWSDMLLEEQLLEKGQKIDLDHRNRKQLTCARGPESYVMPPEALQNSLKKKGDTGAGTDVSELEKPVFVITPASDDPFGDEPIAPAENFGVKKSWSKNDGKSDDGWWSNRGHARKYANRGGRGDQNQAPTKREYVPKNTAQLMAQEYSLESLLAVEFMDGIPVEQLGDEIARAMGEKEPETVKKIVNSVGTELSLKLFNETREIEKSGGMKTADGSRRRTPGGVFITLFKMDPDVTREVKTSIFGDMKQIGKEKSKTRKRGYDYARKLDDMKKTMEEAAKEEKELENEAGNEKLFDEISDVA